MHSVDCALATSVNNQALTDFLIIRKENKENSYLGQKHMPLLRVRISFISHFARV